MTTRIAIRIVKLSLKCLGLFTARNCYLAVKSMSFHPDTEHIRVWGCHVCLDKGAFLLLE